jgi:type IV pilus assembly protein PilB
METTATKTLRVGDVLTERGLVTAKQVEEAVAVQQSEAKRRLLGEILVELGHCTQAQLIAALADASGIPFVDLTPKFVDPDVIGLLPRDFVNDRHVLPLYKVDDMLTVAVTEPSDIFLVDEIRQLIDCNVQIVAALPEAIKPASRSWPAWISPNGVCPRMGPSACRAKASRWISASPLCPTSSGRRS